MPRPRLLFLLLLALWLPVQSAVAFAMPFCGHAGRPEAHAAAAGNPGGGEQASGHDAHAGHHGAKAAVSDLAGGCDQCGLCHMACAGFMPCSPRQSLAGPHGHVFVDAPLAAVTNPHFDPLDRPPPAAA